MPNLVFIDDDITDHRIFQHLVEKLEIPSVITYSIRPDTIIDYLQDHRNIPQYLPDIIIVDLKMRGFDGYDFLRKYNQLSQYLLKNITIYITSYSLHPKDLELMTKYPFIKEYILKPITDNHLKNMLALA